MPATRREEEAHEMAHGSLMRTMTRAFEEGEEAIHGDHGSNADNGPSLDCGSPSLSSFFPTIRPGMLRSARKHVMPR